MQIICISRGSQSLGDEFAQILAKKLGYECVSRNDLLEEATKLRIPVGKIETSIIKPHLFDDKLLRELEAFKALATSILCSKALKRNIIYHGRTGHLLLPGITNILTLRVVADIENRIKQISQKLNLSREQTKKYISQIDEDRKRWVKTFYNIQWDSVTQYDVILNLSEINTGNAATAISFYAQLSEFQSTPAMTNALKDLYLESRGKLLLYLDKRTRHFNVRVKTSRGKVTITYPAHLFDKIELMTEVLSGIDCPCEFIFTKAQTNILWIQEKYSQEEEAYDEVLKLANNWDAAVELLKFTPNDTEELILNEETNNGTSSETWRETGIFEEADVESSNGSEDMNAIHRKFVRDGRAGGCRSVMGNQKTLINSIDKTADYRLIIFDNVFLSSNPGSKKRKIQEWSNTLSDIIHTPVLNIDELKSKYAFDSEKVIKLIVTSLITMSIVFAIFGFGEQIIEFISSKETTNRIISTFSILAFIPIFAFLYSTVTGLLLKLIKFE